MEYTGKYRTTHSTVCDEDVAILEYKSNSIVPWCNCDRCGKPITRKMYVVQSAETDEIRFCLGSECIRHFS